MNSRNNIIWLSLDKLMLIANGVIISLLLAKYMTQQDFGIYSYVQTIVALFGFVVTLGVDNVVIKQIVKNVNKQDEIIKSVFIMRMGALIFCFSIINIYSYFLEGEIIREYVFLQSFSLFQYLFQSLWLKNQALVNNKPMSIVSIFTQVSLFFSKLVVIYFYESDLYLIFLIDVSAVFLSSFLGLLYYLVKSEFSFEYNFDIKYYKSTLKESLPLFLSSGAIVLYAKIDQVMLKYFIGLEELAGYSIAVKVSQIWYFLPLVVSSVFYPKMISYKALCKDKYNHIIISLLALMSLMSLFFITMYMLLTDYALDFVFNGKYDISLMVIILSMSGYFVSVGYINGKWMVCEGLTYLTLKRNLLGLLFNVALNFILLPYYGGVGASISTLLSIIISSYLSLFFFSKTRFLFYMHISCLKYMVNFQYLYKGLK
ncbi:flippase [Marinomonas communis]|uniref:O-antigen/teichoic acid export membrane protein n=1 Tax=Marinomonas communis TaxID=28254 RepID=A0A4R6X8H9_9GAMM|nr:flippase [Marinomonas communis]TDR13073.1 O-antigen/teichoic acid export membrane protein [Marinomonas communis]